MLMIILNCGKKRNQKNHNLITEMNEVDKMCKKCNRIIEKIRIKRELFETIKPVSSYEYKRGFMNGMIGLLEEDRSNGGPQSN